MAVREGRWRMEWSHEAADEMEQLFIKRKVPNGVL